MIFTKANFSRGMGLGNRLWPWARCKIFSQFNNAMMLSPNWFHIRTATLIKGGIDYSKFFRKVLLYNNFISNEEISGIYKFLISINKNKINESNILPNNLQNKLIIFEGYKNFFGDLIEHKDFLKTELINITHPKWINEYENFPNYEIGINLRMGNDFTHKTPLNWYKHLITSINESNPNIKMVLITDGKYSEVKNLLKLGNIEFINSNSAILDLLILSKSKTIIGSGGSSFTAWGSFLSGATTYIERGRPMNYLNLYNKVNSPVLIELAYPEINNYSFNLTKK